MINIDGDSNSNHDNNELYEHLHDDTQFLDCGTDHVLSEEDEHVDYLRMQAIQRVVGDDISRQNFMPPIGSIRIDVYAHVLTTSRNSDVTRNMMRDEIDMVNIDFEDTPFVFQLKGLSYTSNSRWNDITGRGGDDEDDEIDEAVRELRVGGSNTLNLFLSDGLCEVNLGGFAQYPYEHGWYPPNQFSEKDRVFLCPSVLLGDSRTVTHEIGHWLGLRHTFEGNSCSSTNLGDYVDDTPQHLNSNANDCEDDGRTDTCPSRPGKDPLTNFMSYSRCRLEFTPGQVERMVYQYHEYRKRILPCGEDEVYAQLTVKFDDDPDSFEVAYASYAKDDIDDRDWRQLKRENDDGFANREFSRNLCLPPQTLFAFHLVDEDRNGFDDGGYLTLELDGKLWEFNQEFDRKWQSTFFITDKCSSSGEELFTLELDAWRFDEDLSWQIRDDRGRTLVSRDVTRQYSDEAFRKLYHQVCFEQGRTYDFTLYNGGNTGGYYKLYLGPEKRSEYVVYESDDDRRFEATKTIEIEVERGISNQAPPNYGQFGCVSGSTKVHHEQKGWMAMSDIQIGDSIQVASKDKAAEVVFEPVYAFGHYQPDQTGNFLEITVSSGTTLQISWDHLLFVSPGTAIPAGDLQVGQKLYLEEEEEDNVSTIITKINANVVAHGIYAPFTPSGTLVVEQNLILSNYITLYRYTPWIPLRYHHTIAHLVTGIHRWACQWKNICDNPVYEETTGINVW
eukprot:CAMPEP_0178930854 /NCGR_PEP_ID=MMETSP0786-20121207/21544_1 /TAXON_ID=186022 /ORGANISM="Thalassionema frauenfeldii, Strain CCMP 1798" /LENGTH=729 /DNA_ID=CAMNT_0020607583 /DNA_START=194 /DNA_END=2380 /DNA_ORIENTATION=+